MSEGSSSPSSSAAPTAFQQDNNNNYNPPTYAPSESPSAAPSIEAFYFMAGSLVTQLYIDEKRTMDTIEHELFVGIMEGHTESIGDNLTSPFVKTYCTILSQVYGTSGDTILLQVSYLMNYTTKYGYDVNEYPELFRRFMNENNATTLEKFVDLIDIPDWSYIQEVGTTVSVTEDNSMQLIATTYAPQSAPEPTTSSNTAGSGFKSPSSGTPSDDNSHLSSSTRNSKRRDTLVGLLLGFSIVILFTVLAAFVRVYRKKNQPRHGREEEEEGDVVATTNTDDRHQVFESPIDLNATSAAPEVKIANSLDDPSSKEIPPFTPIACEQEIMIKDDDTSIMNEAILSFALPLPIDVSDAQKGIITALDTTPTAMMAEEGDAHHDRFSSGLSPLSFLIETESTEEIIAVGSNQEEVIATLELPLSFIDAEMGTAMTSSMETVPTANFQRGSGTSLEPLPMSNDQHSNEIGTSSVTFAPEVAQTIVLEQFIDTTIQVQAIDSDESVGVIAEEVTTPQFEYGTFEGANLMAIRSDSLSSESHDDESLPSQASTGYVLDEFDKYRDNLLDVLIEEVESVVDGVHVPLRLAIAQILADITEQGAAPPLDLSWIGGEDLGSIEASCLCHACTWEQSKDSSAGECFFEDMINKIVLIVHHGLLTPHDGARILHGCASIVGLTLLKELPNTTVVIQGLMSTNEVAHGHHLLVSAFEQFGEIVDASICPQNRGFGFVRFANSESIDKVLNEPAMVIQDIAVSITTLLR